MAAIHMTKFTCYSVVAATNVLHLIL